MPQDIPLISGRPRIHLAGQRRQDLESGLLRMGIAEHLGRPSACRIRLTNWGPDRRGRPDFEHFDSEGPWFGEELRVQVYYRDALLDIFNGRVVGLEGIYPDNRPPELEIRAEDALEALRRFTRSREFRDATDAQIAESIASEYGLTPLVDLEGGTHDTVVQLQQNDLAFLVERVRLAGGDVRVRDGRLIALPRGKSDVPTVSLERGAELTAFRARADLTGQVSTLRVHGWDNLNKQPALGQALAGSAADMPGFADGGSVVHSTLGPGEWQGARSAAGDPNSAETIARSYYRERSGEFLRGSGSGPGLPQIWAGRRVLISGLGDWFDGEYQVRRLLHSFDPDNGYETDFETERPSWRVKRLRRRPDDYR